MAPSQFLVENMHYWINLLYTPKKKFPQSGTYLGATHNYLSDNMTKITGDAST
jgi:hypothetical protein